MIPVDQSEQAATRRVQPPLYFTVFRTVLVCTASTFLQPLRHCIGLNDPIVQQCTSSHTGHGRDPSILCTISRVGASTPEPPLVSHGSSILAVVSYPTALISCLFVQWYIIEATLPVATRENCLIQEEGYYIRTKKTATAHHIKHSSMFLQS